MPATRKIALHLLRTHPYSHGILAGAADYAALRPDLELVDWCYDSPQEAAKRLNATGADALMTRLMPAFHAAHARRMPARVPDLGAESAR